MAQSPQLDGWALVLGASSGFGGATSVELARHGMDIFGVHLDRAQTLPLAQQVAADVEATGRRAVFFNVNAADDGKRAQTIESIRETTGGKPTVSLLLHSLAFGTLRSFIAFDESGNGAVGDRKQALTRAQLEMTLDVMANSLVYWVQDLVYAGLMARGASIWAMTSAGDLRVIPTYGAVSAAKSCLDSHVRQLAVELAPLGIRVNAIRAGITDTPALRKIPVNAQLIEHATQRNPSGRMTTPADVAQAIATLAQPGAAWMTGNVINVDGGEETVA